MCTTSRWLLFGETGVGKTLFGLEIGGAISAGASFLNWDGTGRSTRVVYFDGETPAETFKERMEFIGQRYGPDRPLYGYNRDILKDEDLPPLNTPEGEKWLWREIEAVKPELVLFDSIMCLLGGSMSEEESWAPVKALVPQLSGRRIAQVWLHHTGHDATKSFGTKTREWEMDTVVSLTKRGDDDDSLALEFKKARLRTPETREQFQSRILRCGAKGWTADGAQLAKPNSGRSNALLNVSRAIVAACSWLANSVEPSRGFDGPLVRKVPVEAIRNEVKSLGFIETNESGGLTNTGRSMFHRAKSDLLAAKTHVENEGLFWEVSGHEGVSLR